jgi:hypothetical protein
LLSASVFVVVSACPPHHHPAPQRMRTQTHGRSCASPQPGRRPAPGDDRRPCLSVCLCPCLCCFSSYLSVTDTGHSSMDTRPERCFAVMDKLSSRRNPAFPIRTRAHTDARARGHAQCARTMPGALCAPCVSSTHTHTHTHTHAHTQTHAHARARRLTVTSHTDCHHTHTDCSHRHTDTPTHISGAQTRTDARGASPRPGRPAGGDVRQP